MNIEHSKVFGKRLYWSYLLSFAFSSKQAFKLRLQSSNSVRVFSNYNQRKNEISDSEIQMWKGEK